MKIGYFCTNVNSLRRLTNSPFSASIYTGTPITTAKGAPMMKKLTACLLVLCLLLGTVLPMPLSSARAESFAVYVSSNTLPVYSKASTGASLMGTMSYGEAMLCLAYSGGWAKVQNSAGQVGYCAISDLTVNNPNTLNKTAYITTSNTPVYKKPDTSSRVMMLLKQNSSWTAVAITADKQWVRLQNGRYYGYVQTGKLSTSAVSSSTSSSGTTTSTLNTPVYISANTLNAYDRPSTSGKVLGVMSYGEGMTLLATSGSWARIRNSAGTVGYCLLSGLTTSNPNNLSQKIYITSDGVYVFRKPNTASGVMMKLSRNSSYTCVAVTSDGAWARLQNGNYYGYVATQYISSVLPEEESSLEKTVYISTNVLPVYSQPYSTASALGTMSFGESLILMAVEDGWAKVRNASGAVGYCLYGGLTATNPNTLNAAYYTAEEGVNFYSAPASGAKIVKTAALNTSVMVVVLSEDALWARVNLGSSYAYVPMHQLSESKTAVDDGSIEAITPKTVYISATTLPCYAQNSATSTVLGTMSFGESLSCTGTGDGWARVVNSSGTVGYCLLSGLTDKNPNSYNVTMYAQANGVKVYAKASTSSTVLSTLNLNSKVTAVAISSDKQWVRLQSGSVYSYALSSTLATTQASTANTSVAAKVIALATQQIGVKYVYAAQSPSTGFDCSGLTYYVYKNAAGITLKRTAYTQGYNDSYTKITSISSLQPGDLVFFNTVSTDSDLCDHVGIYIGGSKFIHASSAKGEVTTSEISNGNYYARTFSWGRRVLS